MTDLELPLRPDRALSMAALNVVKRMVAHGNGEEVRLSIDTGIHDLTNLESQVGWRVWVLVVAEAFEGREHPDLYLVEERWLPRQLQAGATNAVPPFQESAHTVADSPLSGFSHSVDGRLHNVRSTLWLTTNDPVIVTAALSIGARATAFGWTEADVFRTLDAETDQAAEDVAGRLWSFMRDLESPVLVEGSRVRDLIDETHRTGRWAHVAAIWHGLSLSGVATVGEMCLRSIADAVLAGRFHASAASAFEEFEGEELGTDLLDDIQTYVANLQDPTATKVLYDWLLPPEIVAEMLNARELLQSNNGADEYWGRVSIPEAEVDTRARTAGEHLPLVSALGLIASDASDSGIAAAIETVARDVLRLDEQMRDLLETFERAEAGSELVRIIGSRRRSRLMAVLDGVHGWDRVVSFDEEDIEEDHDLDEDAS